MAPGNRPAAGWPAPASIYAGLNMVADPKRGRPRKPRRTNGQLERFLSTGDAIKALGAAVVHQQRRKLKRDRKNLERIVPSRPWFDASWDAGQAFPPGGDTSTMRTCRKCGRKTPPTCLSARDVCLDCQYGGMSNHELATLPSSCSVVDMGRLKASHRRGEQYDGSI